MLAEAAIMRYFSQWFAFLILLCCYGTDLREILIQNTENKDQNNFEYENFLRSEYFLLPDHQLTENLILVFDF